MEDENGTYEAVITPTARKTISDWIVFEWFKSTNGGETWTQLDSGSTVYFVTTSSGDDFKVKLEVNGLFYDNDFDDEKSVGVPSPVSSVTTDGDEFISEGEQGEFFTSILSAGRAKYSVYYKWLKKTYDGSKALPFYLIRECGYQDTIIESSEYNFDLKVEVYDSLFQETTISNIHEVTVGDGKSGKIVITQDKKKGKD